MNEVTNIAGQRIKERRTAMGLSLRELAALMDYSNHSTIARIESGAIDLPRSKIVKFAEVLKTTPAWLMGWDQEPEDQAAFEADILTDPELMGMIREYMTLSEEKKKAVRQMIHALSSD